MQYTRYNNVIEESTSYHILVIMSDYYERFKVKKN